MHETFGHTADLGLRVRAADLDTLFVEAAQCLFEAIVDDLNSVKASCRVDIALASDQMDFLLFDWLKALLFYFDSEHLLFGKFEVHLAETGLMAKAWGEPLDRARHNLDHEVKAITYHGLRVEKDGDGWLAELIVDI